MKKLLTIAGSDSSGGAGIQADIKTFSAFGCYAMSVITAVTAQNTVGVLDIQDIKPELIAKQMSAIFEDLPPDGVKIGMLSVPETITVVADGLAKYQPPVTVLDPVMVSKSGFHLLKPESISALKSKLLPLADMITPNLPEAEILCDCKITTHKDMEQAAKKLHQMGARTVLLKGGHLDDTADDVFFDGHNLQWFSGVRIPTKDTHGTGCTLSSALAAAMAQGHSPTKAVEVAKAYITGAIQNALPIGAGCGPTNHFYQFWKS